MSAERLTRGGALTTATREGVLFTAAAAAAAPSGKSAAAASAPELSTTGTCGGSGQAAIVGMAAAGEREIPPGGPKLSLSKQPFPRRRRAKGAALGDCSWGIWDCAQHLPLNESVCEGEKHTPGDEPLQQATAYDFFVLVLAAVTYLCHRFIAMCHLLVRPVHDFCQPVTRATRTRSHRSRGPRWQRLKSKRGQCAPAQGHGLAAIFDDLFACDRSRKLCALAAVLVVVAFGCAAIVPKPGVTCDEPGCVEDVVKRPTTMMIFPLVARYHVHRLEPLNIPSLGSIDNWPREGHERRARDAPHVECASGCWCGGGVRIYM